jgi:8-oxo-dGTP diphosphatase
MPKSEPKNRVNVTTVFLEHEKKILILKRSQKVKTMKTKWAGISGYIEHEEPLIELLRKLKKKLD